MVENEFRNRTFFHVTHLRIAKIIEIGISNGNTPHTMTRLIFQIAGY